MIQFCSHCGHTVVFETPPGDNLPRHVCPACGHIHYENPRLIVGCIATWEDRILLCKRAIEPRLGYWTLPAGFMENGESTAAAARRETLEEAGADPLIGPPFAMISIPHISQIHLFYLGQLANGEYAAGEESLAVGLYREEEIPWQELSFRSVHFCLERFLDDRRKGHYQFHEQVFGPDGCY